MIESDIQSLLTIPNPEHTPRPVVAQFQAMVVGKHEGLHP
jgi:hypothetical protein